MKKLSSFQVIGVEIITANSPGRAEQDIPALWDHFYTNEIQTLIPNKKSETLLVVYSDYEGDYTKPYSYLIGCEVTTDEEVPEGMIAKTVPAQKYKVFKAKGPSPQTIVETWQKIWKQIETKNLKRSYTYDFEIYNTDEDIDIYISVTD